MGNWEKCPVCEGRGNVPRYFHGDYSTDSNPDVPLGRDLCKCCLGEMIICSKGPEIFKTITNKTKKRLEQSIKGIGDIGDITTPLTRKEIKEIGLVNGIEDEILADFCIDYCDESEMYNLDSIVRVRHLIELVKQIREDQIRKSTITCKNRSNLDFS